MRFTAAIACGLMTLDCAGKAMGTVPQELLAPDNTWVWWVVAASWAIVTLSVAFRGAK